MGSTDVQKTRNFALVGHSGDGKTSLGESLLHLAGASPDLGRVDQGSSLLNHLPEEKDGHTHSITSHIFSFEHAGHRLNLVDTPGDPNFQGDGQIALQAPSTACYWGNVNARSPGISPPTVTAKYCWPSSR